MREHIAVSRRLALEHGTEKVEAASQEIADGSARCSWRVFNACCGQGVARSIFRGGHKARTEEIEVVDAVNGGGDLPALDKSKAATNGLRALLVSRRSQEMVLPQLAG